MFDSVRAIKSIFYIDSVQFIIVCQNSQDISIQQLKIGISMVQDVHARRMLIDE